MVLKYLLLFKVNSIFDKNSNNPSVKNGSDQFAQALLKIS